MVTVELPNMEVIPASPSHGEHPSHHGPSELADLNLQHEDELALLLEAQVTLPSSVLPSGPSDADPVPSEGDLTRAMHKETSRKELPSLRSFGLLCCLPSPLIDQYKMPWLSPRKLLRTSDDAPTTRTKVINRLWLPVKALPVHFLREEVLRGMATTVRTSKFTSQTSQNLS